MGIADGELATAGDGFVGATDRIEETDGNGGGVAEVMLP